MDYYVNMDGMKIKVVYAKDLIIGQPNKINAVRQNNISYMNLVDICLVRKGEMNDSCDVDYQCHREIGFVCDKPPGISSKICVNLFYCILFH
jgi:hypothetical protein